MATQLCWGAAQVRGFGEPVALGTNDMTQYGARHYRSSINPNNNSRNRFHEDVERWAQLNSVRPLSNGRPQSLCVPTISIHPPKLNELGLQKFSGPLAS